MIELPEELDHHWALRGYYGTVNHNVKATYVKYLGWFDGNPATLHTLPPEEASKRYVEFMGGADAILEKARAEYEKGEYRWVAEVVNHVVFADPSNADARALQADTLEQLGYQSEAGTWRNLYLTATQDLRQGVAKIPFGGTASPDTIKAMTLELLFDYMGVRLNGPDAAAATITLNLNVSDTGERAVLELTNGSLNHSIGRQDADADATLTMDRPVLSAVVLGEMSSADAIAQGVLTADPDAKALDQLLGFLDSFDFWFNIVEP